MRIQRYYQCRIPIADPYNASQEGRGKKNTRGKEVFCSSPIVWVVDRKVVSLGAFCRVVVAVVDSSVESDAGSTGGEAQRRGWKKGHRAGDKLKSSAARCEENKTEVGRRHPAKV